jgi:transposase
MTTKIDGRGLDHKTLEHLRKLAVRRVVEDGERPSDVMDMLGFCRTSIYPWLREFEEAGFEALVERIATGPESKLNEKQRQQVRRWILGKDPRQYGFDYGLWTRKIVQGLIGKRMGIDLGLTAVGRLLARMDITPQKPLRRAYERDPQAVQEWKDIVYPQLRARAKRQQAKIFFCDEAGFHSDPALGRTYGLKGHTPIVRTSGQRQAINAISAINAQGAFWSMTYDGKLNAESFALFLENFMSSRRKNVFLVVDGHPSHRAKSVQKYVHSLRGRLELHFLPPYAPDLNPDEFVWHHMKSNGVSKKPLKRNESLRRRVERDLRDLSSNPALIRSLFRADSVVYAKD